MGVKLHFVGTLSMQRLTTLSSCRYNVHHVHVHTLHVHVHVHEHVLKADTKTHDAYLVIHVVQYM